MVNDRPWTLRAGLLAGVMTMTLALGGCGDEPTAETPAAARGAAAPTDAAPPAARADAGTIEVRVTYQGEPNVETIRINKDVEACGKEAPIAKLVLGESGSVANAVVSVRGLDGPPTARTPKLDQQGCQFQPHVVAMQPGELEIHNSDGVLHNIHTYSEANDPINKAQPKFKKVMTETFTKPEFIKVTCDVHSWMLGWIAVMPHPYFGVTGDAGVARIEGVPAGSHTIEVWHEELGRRTADVAVKAGETVKTVIEFPKKSG